MRSILLSCGLALVSISLAGCAGRDLGTLCSVADEVVHDNPELDGQEKARLFGQLVHERLSMFGSTRDEIIKAAVLPPGKRYKYIREAAARLGHPEFDCPALKAVLEPEEIFDELVPD